MDEAEWLASKDPAAMLRHLTHETLQSWTVDGAQTIAIEQERESPLASPRKLRLFVCAWWRSIPPHDSGQEEAVVAVDEHGVWTSEQTGETWTEKDLLDQCLSHDRPHLAHGAALLRGIVGSPFRPAAVLPRDVGRVLDRMKEPGLPQYQEADVILTDWLTPLVLDLARAAYLDRLQGAALDSLTLLAVADALEEAGCDGMNLLWHLRGLEPCDDPTHSLAGGSYWCPKCGGTEEGTEGWMPIISPHVCGCWATDLVLGKE